ncbi:MAG: TerC family protein [Rhodomicrobium sp.]|nr:TerC family protein [Rhodomicrobium sp.]
MEILFADLMGQPAWMWLGFIVIVCLLLAFDLGVLNRNSREIGVRESLLLSGFYMSIGLAFAIWIYYRMGQQSSIEYLTGFVVEKSLALDNIFVIAMIFTYFGIPRQYQHRVLVYGILGVIILRGIMIGAGAQLVQEFEWILYLFAAFLIFTGIKMFAAAGEEYDVGSSPILKFIQKRMRVTDELHGERFFVRLKNPQNNRIMLYATPLFIALIMIELADVVFAVDSIPAIFAITTDPYIVYTSNIFAILGLRALYFALSAMLKRFVYLKHALASVLVFIGTKIFAADMLGLAKIPPELSLLVTVSILTAGIVVSLWVTRGSKLARQ